MTLQAAIDPRKAIDSVTYAGQDASRRMYHAGYEQYMNELPVLNHRDFLFDEKVAYTKGIVQNLAESLQAAKWPRENMPVPGGFDRTIIAIQDREGQKEGAELVVARWGAGFSSPVHGHAPGYMHEDIIRGKMLVTTYRILSDDEMVVAPIRMDIVGPGTFVSQYNMERANDPIRRRALVHSFTALEPSVSLHYLSEHTRDGRDNTFTVVNFEDTFKLTQRNVERITSQQGLYLRVGDVALVRSSNVPDYGDHFIVITGGPVMKEHGMRPQDVAVPAKSSALLDQYDTRGLVLLKLDERAKGAFYNFHGIQMVNGKVIFPQS